MVCDLVIVMPAGVRVTALNGKSVLAPDALREQMPAKLAAVDVEALIVAVAVTVVPLTVAFRPVLERDVAADAGLTPMAAMAAAAAIVIPAFTTLENAG